MRFSAFRPLARLAILPVLLVAVSACSLFEEEKEDGGGDDPTGFVWTQRADAETLIGRYLSLGPRLLATAMEPRFLSSADGASWDTIQGMIEIGPAVWAGTEWVGLGVLDILASSDGVTWTIRKRLEWNPRALANHAGTLVGAGSSGTIYVSRNKGVDWQVRNTEPFKDFNAVARIGDRWMVIGGTGDLRMSLDDGLTWTAHETGTPEQLFAIAGNDSLVLITSEDGLLLSSSDKGQTWTPRETRTPRTLRALARTATHWVAVGDRGAIRVSADGIVWEVADSPTQKDLYSVAWTGSRLVIGGEEGVFSTK